MKPVGCPLSPSSSLPPLRGLDSLTSYQYESALQNLRAVYLPFLNSSSNVTADKRLTIHETSSAVLDSGYVSATDEEEDPENALLALRTDNFERNYTKQWLRDFIFLCKELDQKDKDTERLSREAEALLDSFHTPAVHDGGDTTNEHHDNDNEDNTPAPIDEDDLFSRKFSFPLTTQLPAAQQPGEATVANVIVHLNDGLSGMNPNDPHDVGLQSWSASIIFSQLMCANPRKFGLIREETASTATRPSPLPPIRIVELGAGTGLVSLTLGGLLPHLKQTEAAEDGLIVATDFHPTVLANLRANISFNVAANAGAKNPAQLATVDTCTLDWSAPDLTQGPLAASAPADLLFATDVIYAPEHAKWLRDCAAQLLAPAGVFWLMVTIRQKGRFESWGIGDMVEAAFPSAGDLEDFGPGGDGRSERELSILGIEAFEKRKGIGRGDESGHKLYRIGWA